LKEYELVKTKTEKEFSVNKEYFISESGNKLNMMVKAKRVAKIYIFDISKL